MDCGEDFEGDAVYAGLCVDSSKQIRGTTSAAALDGAGLTRILYVSPLGELELNDLALRNGYAQRIGSDYGQVSERQPILCSPRDAVSSGRGNPELWQSDGAQRQFSQQPS